MRDPHLASEELMDPLGEADVAHLGRCRACADRRSSVLKVRAAIGALDRGMSPPPSAQALVEQAVRTRRARAVRRRWAGLVACAAVVGALVVSVIRWRASAPFAGAFMDEIALDHLHYVGHPNPAQFSGSREELVRWFVPTLGHPLRLAPLEATDYLGGRNCWLRGKYAALVLADRASHRLSLFDIPDVPPRRAGCGSAQGVRVCAMPDPDGGARVIVGDLPDAEMMRLLSESI